VKSEKDPSGNNVEQAHWNEEFHAGGAEIVQPFSDSVKYKPDLPGAKGAGQTDVSISQILKWVGESFTKPSYKQYQKMGGTNIMTDRVEIFLKTPGTYKSHAMLMNHLHAYPVFF
jgi:hypothetical protein